MVLNAKKFLKLQKKVEKTLIGSYGSAKGLGQDLIIKKYSYETNDYGDKTATYISEETCKGIVINSTDFKLGDIPTLKVKEEEIKLYIPVNIDVEDTETIHYEFVLGSDTYELVDKNDIGQVCNITGVVREITLKPKD